MEPQRIGPSNCLPKTQVCAKSKDDVYELTPARCWKVKRSCLLYTSEADNGLPADVKAEAARKAEERLKYMTFYSTTQHCLRGFLLQYFGEARCV